MVAAVVVTVVVLLLIAAVLATLWWKKRRRENVKLSEGAQGFVRTTSAHNRATAQDSRFSGPGRPGIPGKSALQALSAEPSI